MELISEEEECKIKKSSMTNIRVAYCPVRSVFIHSMVANILERPVINDNESYGNREHHSTKFIGYQYNQIKAIPVNFVVTDSILLQEWDEICREYPLLSYCIVKTKKEFNHFLKNSVKGIYPTLVIISVTREENLCVFLNEITNIKVVDDEQIKYKALIEEIRQASNFSLIENESKELEYILERESELLPKQFVDEIFEVDGLIPERIIYDKEIFPSLHQLIYAKMEWIFTSEPHFDFEHEKSAFMKEFRKNYGYELSNLQVSFLPYIWNNIITQSNIKFEIHKFESNFDLIDLNNIEGIHNIDINQHHDLKSIFKFEQIKFEPEEIYNTSISLINEYNSMYDTKELMEVECFETCFQDKFESPMCAVCFDESSSDSILSLCCCTLTCVKCFVEYLKRYKRCWICKQEFTAAKWEYEFIILTKNPNNSEENVFELITNLYNNEIIYNSFDSNSFSKHKHGRIAFDISLIGQMSPKEYNDLENMQMHTRDFNYCFNADFYYREYHSLYQEQLQHSIVKSIPFKCLPPCLSSNIAFAVDAEIPVNIHLFLSERYNIDLPGTIGQEEHIVPVATFHNV